jgi:hypothetical protein
VSGNETKETFIAERPPQQALKVMFALSIADAVGWAPPSQATLVRGFEAQHFPALEMLIADPDGRELAVHAPLAPEGGAR